jgi:hypothetical protein
VVSGAHAGEFDVGKGELAVQMECEPSLAKTATQALVTLWDPGARISAPLWRRTERLSRRVLATLESLELPAGWQEAADRLRRDPLDREAQRAVRELIERPGVVDRGNAGAALRAAVEEFEGRNRIVLDTGACHDRTVACPEIDLVRQLADGIVAPLDTARGNWELTVVLDVRDTTSGDRLRNAVASCLALQDQTLPRERYRIVVVEQDEHPRHAEVFQRLADLYVHAVNAGPYNRSWAHNVGAVATGGHEDILCFLDADVLPPREFLLMHLKRLRTEGGDALLPHASLLYLDGLSTNLALEQRFARGGGDVDRERLHGYQLVTNRGGCVLVRSSLFHDIHGFDERYEGWGDEDNEFYRHLTGHTSVIHGSEVLLHLDHPRPLMEQDGRRPNERLLGDVASRPTRIGLLDRYTSAPGAA